MTRSPSKLVGEEVGVASAFKLSIYGFNKGLVALFLEMVVAADQIGLRDELIQCLRDFYPGSVETVERLLPSYPRHAHRRAQEMTEVVEWLGELGLSADMAAATRAVIQDVASLAAARRWRTWTPRSWSSTCAAEGYCGAAALRRPEHRPAATGTGRPPTRRPEKVSTGFFVDRNGVYRACGRVEPGSEHAVDAA